MKIGYARVSTRDQNLDLQLDALAKAGCEKTYREEASGAWMNRPILSDVLAYLRDGDTLVVWKCSCHSATAPCPAPPAGPPVSHRA